MKGSDNNTENKVAKPIESILEYKPGGKITKGDNNETKNKTDTKGSTNITNTKESEKKKGKQTEKIIKQGNRNIDPTIKSPELIYGINTRKKSVNELLQRAISNAARHGLNLKPGQINNMDGNCLWEALIYNIMQRQCIKSKNRETPRQLKQRSLENAHSYQRKRESKSKSRKASNLKHKENGRIV